MKNFIEIHETQNFANITPEEALIIMQNHLDTYQEGERFKRKYQTTRDALEAIYGGKINKRKTITSTPTKELKTKGSEILKNDNVRSDEKFRYVRITQTRDIVKQHISKSAHHTWLALQISQNSNSAGAFPITLKEIMIQTISNNVNEVIKDINDLTALGELFYINGAVYLTHFHANQSQHGNINQLKGILNNYNDLKDDQKLPYIGGYNTTSMTFESAVIAFTQLKNAIEIMGALYAKQPVTKERMMEVWTEEQIAAILGGKTNYSLSNPVEVITLDVDITLPSVEVKEVVEEEEITPVLNESPQPEERSTQQQQEETSIAITLDEVSEVSEVAEIITEQPKQPIVETKEMVIDNILDTKQPAEVISGIVKKKSDLRYMSYATIDQVFGGKYEFKSVSEMTSPIIDTIIDLGNSNNDDKFDKINQIISKEFGEEYVVEWED